MRGRPCVSACAALAVVALFLATPIPCVAGDSSWIHARETLVLFDADAPGGAAGFVRALEAAGGHAAVVHPEGVAIVFAEDATLASPAVGGRVLAAHRAAVAERDLPRTGGARLVRAWNERLKLPPDAGLDVHAVAPTELLADAGPRPTPLGRGPSGPRLLTSARMPYGAQYYDTSEFLAGWVAVGLILMESTGPTYNWSTVEENQTIGGVQAALANWVIRAGPAAALTFFLETNTQVPVTGEPIETTMSQDQNFVGQALTAMGWAGANAFEQCFAYINGLRETYDTHWCYAIVIADSDDAVNQGRFTNNGYAWAYYGGPWVYMSRYSSWAYNSANYYSAVPQHETGHIFMATDEYNSQIQYGGYLNVPDNLPSVTCTMNQNTLNIVCAATRGQLGVRDTDADGAVDVMDVPPTTTLAAVPEGCTTDTQPTWTGSANVNTLDNLNPISNYFPPHDQTIATIATVECRVDGGSWSAATPVDGMFDDYAEDYSWTPASPLALGVHVIEARARTSVGVYSTLVPQDRVRVTTGLCSGPTTIVDTTPGTATLDGVVDAGEYVGHSFGINYGFANVIGDRSELSIDSASDGTLSLGLVGGGGSLDDRMVVYIDTGAGGFATTGSFTDVGDPLRRAISGFNGTNRSRLDFGPGFTPAYAIAIEAGSAGLWALVESGSHSFVRSLGITPAADPGAGQWEVALDMSDLGLAPGAAFDYVATYLNSETASRSDEFHGVAPASLPPGNPGHATVTLGAADRNTFVSVGQQVDVPADELPLAGALEAVRPNPFTVTARIGLALRRGGPVRLDVYDVLGHRVARLVDRALPAGRHDFDWDGRDAQGRGVAAGIYYVAVRAPEMNATRRLVKIR